MIKQAIKSNVPKKMIMCFVDNSNHLTKINVTGMSIPILQRYIDKKFGLMICKHISNVSTFTPIEFIYIDNVEDTYNSLTQHFEECDNIGFQLDKNIHSLNLDNFSLLHHFQKELSQKTHRHKQLCKEIQNIRLYGDDMERAASESTISIKKRELERIPAFKKVIKSLIQRLQESTWDNECPLCHTYVSDIYVQTAYKLICSECYEQLQR